MREQICVRREDEGNCDIFVFLILELPILTEN